MLTTAGKRARGTQPITQQPPSVLVRQRDCPVHLNLGPNYGGCFSSLIDLRLAIWFLPSRTA